VGKTTEAIGALKSSLNNLNSFIASKEPSTKKGIAVKSLFETMDNLAGIYKELGDLKQAKELLEFSYEQKQKQLSKNEPAIFISQILLGQLYYATKDFDKAKQYLNSGLELIGQADGDYLFYQADACNTLALLYDKKDNNKQAAYYYEKADSLYEESLQGEYDDIYLDFLRNAALFYADNGQPATAIAKANKGYDYVVKTQGAQTLIAFYQLLNLAEVSLVSGKFKEAIKYSRRGLDVVNNTIRTSSNLLDSIKVELKKPKAILLKSKAEYELLPKKDVANLTVLLKEVQEAFGLLERRKSVISDANDISLLMADHTDLIDFAKKITYDLYKLTDESTYISELMNLQESGIYNRIRARLDKNDSLQFLHIPLQVQATEKQLKMALTSALQGSEQHNKRTERYFKALDEWNKYQETIRLKYPKYYEMRYASIFKSVGDLQQVIPAATTLIRYFYIDKRLYAVVADNKQKKVFALKENTIVERINELSLHSMDAGRTAENLQLLYRQLWLPLAKNIHYKKVVIVPDGILYNLNFEILTPQRITSFREIAAKSLLADYTISYHYSLILLAQKTTKPVIQDNFIAFAPGFSDKTKEKYRNSVKDSVKMDRAYLSLLPQPFTLALATNTQQLLGGNAFINEESTESAFKANAGHHKIIHIGTHAESNNDYPEFSRLLFAKNTFANQEDNSLYVDEIYNCDLASQLTVLTACESGKPGYEDGEGMISLTHAFNYAGSESIVTGLWKIDEQASALLLDIFYKNLEKGLPKDEALRQAKLTYLKTAEGRMLAPQYWAGLVIMGDVSPIVFEQNRVFSPVAIIGIFCLFVLAIFILVRKKVSK
jgi:CHAT domain-containing protein